MKWNMKLPVAGLLVILAVPGNASADPHSDGLSLGQNNLNKLSSKVSSSNAKGMPYYTDKPPQSQQFGSSSLFDVGASRITTCKTAAHGSDKVANQECDAVNFLAKNPEQRVKFPVNPNDPIISGIGNTINNATAGPVTEACTTKTTTTPDIYATQVCNEYNLAEPKQCSIGQIVEVNADSNFKCNVTKNALETLNCNKTLIVACSTPVDGCDNGGIIPGSTQGDMQTSWGPIGGGTYALAFGVIGDNYWWSGVYDRTLTFNVSDPSTITQFALASVLYDDYLMVKVNGVMVFNGPYGGSDLTTVMSTCGRDHDPCLRVSVGNGQLYGPELGNSWSSSPGVDLRPFLHAGQNVIQTRTIVGGQGETQISISARMMCPGTCTYNWDDQCATLNSRSQ